MPSALLEYLRAHALELFGFITGVGCVSLLVRQNIWNWPLGLANNLLFMVIFTRSGLYADVGLQGFYVVIGVYGWWHWLHGGADHGTLKVSRIPLGEALVAGTAFLLGTTLMVAALRRWTNSTVPVADAVVTGLSLTAQVLMARKRMENWGLWIVANVISIWLLLYKRLYISAGLYGVYLVLCVQGLRAWWASGRKARPAMAAVPSRELLG